jgi:hypothetical protein
MASSVMIKREADHAASALKQALIYAEVERKPRAVLERSDRD